MKPIKLGTTKSLRLQTDAQDSAAAIGNTGVDVVSTISIISMLEECCHQLLKDHFEVGEASVGTIVNVVHRSPLPLGSDLDVVAEVKYVKSRKIEFFVSGQFRGDVIMDGIHERVVIDLEQFRQGVGKP